MAGAGDKRSLAGGQDLCMAGVLLAHGFHMQMGGCHAPARTEVTLLVRPQACKAVDLVQGPAVSPFPRGALNDFGLLPSCPVEPLGLR